MIVYAVDVPPPFYPLACEEKTIDFDPYGPSARSFRLAPTTDHVLGRLGTTNSPPNVGSDHVSIGSRWRAQTSARLHRPIERVISKEDVREIDVPGQLAEIKRLTGFGWEQLATLLGCSRQSLHLWSIGEPIADGNRERLARLHATVAYVDRGNEGDNRVLMDASYDGSTVADLLAQGQFARVKALAGRGPGRPDAHWGRVAQKAEASEDHWFARLAQLPVEAEAVRAKPQSLKRLRMKG